MIDQGLKERLTGAVVLVLLGVIFIPLFLDGPDARSDGRETRMLDLPAAGPNKAEADPSKPPQERDKSKDRNSRETVSAGAVDRAPDLNTDAAKNAKPEARAAAQGAGKETARPATVVADNPLSAWAVQVGSFSSQDNAERLSEDLKKRGYRAFVTRLSTKSRTLYRVRVGPEQERERAELLARRLKKDGEEADVVPHP